MSISKSHFRINTPRRFSLFEHWSEFYLDMYETLKQFPKRDKYALGLRIENTALSALDLILLSNKKTAPTKITILENIDNIFAREKILIRMAHKIKALSDSSYRRLEGRLIILGKEVGGWLKYEKNNIEKLKLSRQSALDKTLNIHTKIPNTTTNTGIHSENMVDTKYSETEKEQ